VAPVDPFDPPPMSVRRRVLTNLTMVPAPVMFLVSYAAAFLLDGWQRLWALAGLGVAAGLTALGWIAWAPRTPLAARVTGRWHFLLILGWNAGLAAILFGILWLSAVDGPLRALGLVWGALGLLPCVALWRAFTQQGPIPQK
jgi:hypothetical protein